MGNLELALSAYENALRHNPMSLSGLTQVAGIARMKENYGKVRVPISRHDVPCLAGVFLVPGLMCPSYSGDRLFPAGVGASAGQRRGMECTR